MSPRTFEERGTSTAAQVKIEWDDERPACRGTPEPASPKKKNRVKSTVVKCMDALEVVQTAFLENKEISKKKRFRILEADPKKVENAVVTVLAMLAENYDDMTKSLHDKLCDHFLIAKMLERMRMVTRRHLKPGGEKKAEWWVSNAVIYQLGVETPEEDYQMSVTQLFLISIKPTLVRISTFLVALVMMVHVDELTADQEKFLELLKNSLLATVLEDKYNRELLPIPFTPTKDTVKQLEEYMICDEMLTTFHMVMKDLKETEKHKQEIGGEYRRTYKIYKKCKIVNPHNPMVVQLLQEINEKSDVKLSYDSFVQSCEKLMEDKIKLPEVESAVKYGKRTLVTRKRTALPSAALAAPPPPVTKPRRSVSPSRRHRHKFSSERPPKQQDAAHTGRRLTPPPSHKRDESPKPMDLS